MYDDNSNFENRLPREGTMDVASTDVDMWKLSVVPIVPDVYQKTKLSRSSSLGTSSKLLLFEILLKLQFMMVSHRFFESSNNVSTAMYQLCLTFPSVLRSVSTSQAVRQASLLCLVCYPLQDREEQVTWGQEDPYSTTAIWSETGRKSARKSWNGWTSSRQVRMDRILDPINDLWIEFISIDFFPVTWRWVSSSRGGEIVSSGRIKKR